MKYAITTATGKFGRVAVQHLAELVPVNDIIALARNVDKAKTLLPEGIDIRPGDYTNVAELTQSLAGVDRLLFISSQPGDVVSREQQHLNVVEAAKAAGVGYIAYTSFPHADQATAILATDHQTTETAIFESGIAHSFLRNNWYLENEAGAIKAAMAGQPFVYSAGDGQVGWALEKEYAQAASRVLVTPQPKSVYEFSGAPLTYRELAKHIPGDFEVKSVDDETYADILQRNGLDAGTAHFVTLVQAFIRKGELSMTSDDLPTVLEHPLTPIDEAIAIITK